MHEYAYTNPVYPGYFADPFVWRTGQDYFAVGTGEHEAAGSILSSDEPTIFPMLHSTDLVSWHAIGPALIRPDASFGNTFWAPEVVFADERWWMYYSVGFEDRRHHLRVAASDQATGPYEDCGALTDPAECPFAIDPHAFRDDDGRWYLFHARDFLDEVDELGRAVRPGTALVVHALERMTQLASDGITVARARHDWQRFRAERVMYGGIYDWHTLEGPCVLKQGGRYFCLYSGGCWQTETYGVDYVVADTVLGPYSDERAENGPRVLRTLPDRMVGPGHCSVVLGPGDEQHVIVYHAWDRDMSARRMCIDPLQITEDGLTCSGPSWTVQRLSKPPRSDSDVYPA